MEDVRDFGSSEAVLGRRYILECDEARHTMLCVCGAKKRDKVGF